MWFYDEAEMDWKWFRPGWPESTLETLDYYHSYDVIVMDACTLEIRQTSPIPTPIPTPTPTSITWEFPHGLIQHQAAAFSRRYDVTTVTLANIPPEDIPAELIIVWFYHEAEMDWKWFKPGWPESTLETLEYCHIYDVIVMNACVWEITPIATP